MPADLRPRWTQEGIVRRTPGNVAEGHAAWLHDRPRRQEIEHREHSARAVHQLAATDHQAAALGVDGSALLVKLSQALDHGAIRGKTLGVKLRVAATEVDKVHIL